MDVTDNRERYAAANISAALLNLIIRGFVLEESQRIFNFYAKAEHPGRMNFFGEIMNEVLRSLGGEISARVGVEQPLPGDNERHYSVFLVDSVKSLHDLYANLITFHLYITGLFVVILYKFEDHYYDELLGIFQLNRIVGVIDLDVLVYVYPKIVLLFTVFPFSDHHCMGYAPIVHNRFINSHWQHDNYFPSKLTDLHGCPLVCATWEDMPYFEIERENNPKNNSFRGLEGKLLEFLADKMNFTIEFYWMSDEEIEQTLDDDMAVFNKLFESGTDFAIGAFHYKPIKQSDPYAPTTAYYLSHYNFITSTKSEPYSPFRKLLFPFARDVWQVLLFIIVCGMLTMVVVRCLDRKKRYFIIGARNDTPVYNMFVVSLGGGVAREPRRNFARYLLLLWLIATMVLRGAYQGFMYHFIRTDIRTPLPDTVDELLSQNFTILMTDVTLDAVDGLPRISNRAKQLNGSEVENFSMLQKTTEKVTILTALEYLGYYRNTHVGFGRFHVVPEKVFTQQLCIYMRRNSIMLKLFNENIRRYSSVGLMNKWEQTLLDTRKRKGQNNADDKQQPQPMKIDHIYGAIKLLMVGHAISFAILIGEIIFYGISECCSNLRECICGGEINDDEDYTYE